MFQSIIQELIMKNWDGNILKDLDDLLKFFKYSK